MINVLLIDLDGVLRIWGPQQDTDAEQATGLPPGTIRRIAFSAELLEPAITGRCSDGAWRQRVVQRLHEQYPAVDAERAVQVWSAPAGVVDHAVLEIVRACRRTVKVALITNATSRLPDDLARLGLAGEFDQIINSSEVGACKPHPQIFTTALATFGAAPAETFFVDDSPGHVAAAQRLGIDGHVYQGAAPLVQVLREHGLL